MLDQFQCKSSHPNLGLLSEHVEQIGALQSDLGGDLSGILDFVDLVHRLRLARSARVADERTLVVLDLGRLFGRSVQQVRQFEQFLYRMSVRLVQFLEVQFDVHFFDLVSGEQIGSI